MTAAGSPETSAHRQHSVTSRKTAIVSLRRSFKHRHYGMFDVSSATTLFRQLKAKDGYSYRQTLTACASRCQNLRSVIFARFFTLFVPLLVFSVACFQLHAIYIVIPYFYTSCNVLRFILYEEPTRCNFGSIVY